MKKRYLRLAALTAGVLLTAQTGLSAAALSTFDAAYYAAQYPDVAAVCGNDEGALLRHYLDHGIDEGRKPSADGIAGDDELSLTEAQFSSVWSPVAINKLTHYKSLKRKCTDEEFAQAYQEALKVVTPLALISPGKTSFTASPLPCVRWWMMVPWLTPWKPTTTTTPTVILYCAQHPVPGVPGPPLCVWTFWASPMSM